MPYNHVLVVTLCVLKLHTDFPDEHIAYILGRDFEGYSELAPWEVPPLWDDLSRDLPEWRGVVAMQERYSTLVQGVLSALEDGPPRIRAFPGELYPGMPCTYDDIDEVRVWMCSGGRPDSLMEGSSVVETKEEDGLYVESQEEEQSLW